MRCPHCLTMSRELELLDDGRKLWLVCVTCSKRWTVANTDAAFEAAVRGETPEDVKQIRAYLAPFQIRRPEPS